MIATGRGSTERRHEARPPKTSSAASRYEVLERVSEGTLFIVYRVRERVERPASSRRDRSRAGREAQGGAIRALKALKGAYSRHEQFAPAVLQQAARTAELRHPHLARLFESGREEGTVFLIEEWLPGGSLEKRLRRVPLGPVETNSLAVDLASALEYLHQAGMTHGDVRPRQILFDADGVAKLCDIGLHTAFEAAAMPSSDVQLDATLYTAPERFDGDNATPASDLYSLGVVLYRAVTGRVPFDGPSPLSIAMRHRNDHPLRPTQFNPDCTPELETAILRLLEKEPEDRFASATELLDAIAPDREPQTRSTPSPVALRSDEQAIAGADGASTLAAGAALEAEARPSNLTSDTVNTSRPARLARPPAASLKPKRDFVKDEEILTDEEKERRARLGQRQQGRREMVGALLAFFWLLVFGGLLWGVCYGAYVFWMKEAPPEVRVPQYVGMAQRNAEVMLANKGLQMRVGREVYNPKKPEGTILSGEPQPGKMVRKGRFILVTVSRGEEPIRMVDFSDLTLDQARAIIIRHGLRLGQIAEQYHSRVPKGYVCGQYPETGETFRRSDPINLVISRGPQPSAVPPSPDELPVAPEPPPTAPRVQADDPSVKSPASRATTGETEEVLVPRAAVVSVAIPAGGGPQEIKIVVRDATGDFTAYQETHEAGDVVDKTIQVVRPQNGTALVRVYVGGKLLRELRI
jgi:serine/threonine-protein kinase